MSTMTLALAPRRSFRYVLRLAGPAFAVSIGYIDPGNWASDLAAGAYRFSLLWAILLANVLAIVLQIAVTQVTVRHESDLAGLFARRWPKASPVMWSVFQVAAMATDLAEFTGIVLGAQLLFGLSIVQAVAAGVGIVTALFVFGTRNRSFDAVMVGTLVAIGGACCVLVFALHPPAGEIARGTVVPAIPDGAALLAVVAIVGATVMPHNLFLHSSLVSKRLEETPPHERRRAARFFAGETFVALNIAMLVNGAILVVGACLVKTGGSMDVALRGLATLVGSAGALLFGAAFLISGIVATVTATLSGDVIFAAFSPVKIAPWVRRGLTLLPAVVLLLRGTDPGALLVWSQVALCAILPAVLIPLLAFVRTPRDRSAGARRFFAGCVAATAVCVALDITLFVQCVRG